MAGDMTASLRSVVAMVEQLADQGCVDWPRPFQLDAGQRALVLAPHPDDETMGCGGLLIQHAAACGVACLTDGRHSDPAVPPETAATVRRGEFLQVMESLSLTDYKLFDVEDGQLAENLDRFADLDLGEFDYVFLPSPFEQHPDHLAVTPLVARLLRQRPYKEQLKLAFYEVWSTLPAPNSFVDLSGLAEAKRQLIATYASQVKQIDYPDRIMALNRYRGMVVHRPHAEVYTLVDARTFLRVA